MEINWIAMLIAIALGYLVAAMQFFPTRAVPKWLSEFFAGDHGRANNSGNSRA